MTLAIIIISIYFFLFFIVGTIIKNNSIVDIGWGLGFVLTSVILFFVYDITIYKAIIVIMVSLWGLRLFYYILRRNVFKEEDFRYKQWRQNWGKFVILRALLQVYFLQGFFMFVIGSSVFYFIVNNFEFNTLSYIGIALFLLGYYFEVRGDKQLRDFMKKENRPPLLTTKLWSITRHPNYTGESMIWFGIFLTVNMIPWYFIISPITITLVLRFISIPLLEEKMSKREGWDDYAKRTNAFIPWIKR